MPKAILWTKKADESFDDIIEYLSIKWSEKEISQFTLQTMETLRVISQHPSAFIQDKKTKFRKARINRLISLIYLEKEEHIELLFFWNNRMNPKRIVT